MTILLDTHVFLWILQDSTKLSQKARKLLTNPENQLRMSVISYIEISIKKNLGKLQVDYDLLEPAAEDFGIKTVPLLPAHHRAFHSLPDTLKDPFDRLILATAKSIPAYLMTADANLIGRSDLVLDVF